MSTNSSIIEGHSLAAAIPLNQRTDFLKTKRQSSFFMGSSSLFGYGLAWVLFIRYWQETFSYEVSMLNFLSMKKVVSIYLNFQMSKALGLDRLLFEKKTW